MLPPLHERRMRGPEALASAGVRVGRRRGTVAKLVADNQAGEASVALRTHEARGGERVVDDLTLDKNAGRDAQAQLAGSAPFSLEPPHWS